MTDTRPPPDDWTDREAVEAWLRAQPPDLAVALAARAALRVLPLVWPPRYRFETRFRAGLVLKLIRATAATWLASVASNEGAGDSILTAAADAREAAAHLAPRAACASADAAFAATNAARASRRSSAQVAQDAAFAVDHAARALSDAAIEFSWATAGGSDALSASQAFSAALSAVHDATTTDAAACAEGGAKSIACLPLWPKGEPELVHKYWGLLKAHLLGAHEGWDVWTYWYDRRRRGEPFDVALESKRVGLPERWNDGPAALNAEVKAIIDKHRRGMAERLFQDQRGAIFVEREGRLAIALGDVAFDPRAASMQPRAEAVLQRLADATRSSNQFGALAETAAQLAGIVALPPEEAALRSFEMWSLSGELAQWRRRDDEAKARDDGFVDAMPPDLRQALGTAVPTVALYARSFEDVRRYDEDLAAFEGSIASPATQRAVLDAAREADAIDPHDAETVAGIIARGEETGPHADRAAKSGWFTTRNMVIASASLVVSGVVAGYTGEVGAGLAKAHDAPAKLVRFLDRSGDAIDDLFRDAPDDIRQAVEAVRAWLAGKP